MILHGYWRSTTSYRVRIGLNLKQCAYEQRTHDLRTGEQRDARYLALNPQGLVPAQSPAILEWLDATYPAPPLLPADLTESAIVRSIAATIGCDIHPVNNLRILDALRTDFAATPGQVSAWITRWMTAGFDAIEPQIARHGDGYACGATPTLADCYLVPQVYAAERFAVDLSRYPCLATAAANAATLPAFAAAHPDMQSDRDPL
jgi:maleylpyruvate isomerase